MNKNRMDPLSSSSEEERPPKRRKIDSLKIVPVSGEQLRELSRKYSVLRRRLLKTEATAAQFAKVKSGIGEIVEEEESNLKILLDLDRTEIKRLEASLETSKSSAPNVLELEEIDEVEICQMKSRMTQKLKNLLMKNSTGNHSMCEEAPTFLKFQNNQEKRSGTQKRLRETEEKVELQQMLKGEVEQQMLLPEWNQLFSSFQSEDSTDSGTWSRASMNVGPRPQSLQIVPTEETGRIIAGEPSSLWVLPDASLYPTDDQDSPPEVLDLSLPSVQSNHENEGCRVQEQTRGLTLKIGNLEFPVSHPPNVEIHWEQHYTQQPGSDPVCNRCFMKRNKYRMKDHIWSKHYGGKFRCPFCPVRCMESRAGLRNHICKDHRNQFPPMQ